MHAGSDEEEEALDGAGPSDDLDKAALYKPSKRRNAQQPRISAVESDSEEEQEDEDDSAEGQKLSQAFAHILSCDAESNLLPSE